MKNIITALNGMGSRHLPRAFVAVLAICGRDDALDCAQALAGIPDRYRGCEPDSSVVINATETAFRAILPTLGPVQREADLCLALLRESNLGLEREHLHMVVGMACAIDPKSALAEDILILDPGVARDLDRALLMARKQIAHINRTYVTA